MGSNFSKDFKDLRSEIGLGLGWLRALAQGYSYSHRTIELASDFQNNLMSWVVTLGWLGWLRAVARGYKI